MITLKGYYDNGRIKLFGEAPAKSGDVLVTFTDEGSYDKNLKELPPDFDYKDERAKAVMEEYTKLIRKMR